MITVLTGENSFEVVRALDAITKKFGDAPERFDGSTLTENQLPDLLAGATLFASKRLVIIKSLSENKSLWTTFGDWLPRLSDDIHVVLIEPKPDKRTRTYKDLQKVATINEFKPWTDRDTLMAEAWTAKEATQQGITMDKKNVQMLVRRVGNDQWQLHYALQKLAVLDVVNPEMIERVIEARPTENVFNLFESALKGDARQVSAMIRTLELTEDPFMLFGLLGGQVFQLAALAVSGQGNNEVAKDVGAHPFALQKLAPYARRLGASATADIVHIFAGTDAALKTSGGEPWLLIERALIKVASQV
jgi:DNA polymerase-3 subunit delta